MDVSVLVSKIDILYKFIIQLRLNDCNKEPTSTSTELKFGRFVFPFLESGVAG